MHEIEGCGHSCLFITEPAGFDTRRAVDVWLFWRMYTLRQVGFGGSKTWVAPAGKQFLCP